MKPNYQRTIIACFTGEIVQSVVNNFVPLLFITFQHSYGIPLRQITILIFVNFIVQLTADTLAAYFADRIGYRISVLAAQCFSASGLLLLTVLPERMDPFAGILLSVIIYAIGGGLCEVLISPIMESCPTEHKSASMSLLHSFYCWGHMGVVLLSTLFFHTVGISHWKLLSCFWALLPILNFFLFLKAPIAPLVAEGTRSMSLRELFVCQTFWVLILMMLCAGASEQALIQWASAFAEETLHLPKTIGDLAGPLGFAACMGLSRVIYVKYRDKIHLEDFIKGSCLLCICSYLLVSLSPLPSLSLIGCALCGLSVGILWPGTYSKAAASLRNGGTALFAMLAFSGDLGCAVGPASVGMISALRDGNMRTGIFAAALFPILLLICFLRSRASE